MAVKKEIVTAAGPNMESLLRAYSLPTFKWYGEAFDYSVRVHQIGDDDRNRSSVTAKRARWQKITALRQSLERNDIAIWFDADVLVRRADEDIASRLEADSFQGLALEDVPESRRINPNTGVWVMRHTEEAFDFLDTLEAAGPPAGIFADQGAVMRALGWNIGGEKYHGAGPGKGSPFIERTAWLPLGWNQAYLDRPIDHDSDRPIVPNPHALHFMGLTILEREAAMPAIFANLPAAQNTTVVTTESLL